MVRGTAGIFKTGNRKQLRVKWQRLWRKEATESHNHLSTSACFFWRTLKQSSLKASEMNSQEHLALVWFVFHSLPHHLPVPVASFFWSNTVCVLSYRQISAHIVPCSCMALPSQPTHFWGTLGCRSSHKLFIMETVPKRGCQSSPSLSVRDFNNYLLN